MNKKIFTTFVAAALLASTSISTAQDIEFMGKNGEKVELTPKIEGLRDAIPNRPNDGIQPAQPVQPNRPAFGLGNFGDLRGRTLTVTTPDGETKEISTDDAQSIIINRSFSSFNQNGDRQVKQGGTAVIVDADGQRYEIDLSKIDDEEANGEPIEATPIEVQKSYMIGVFCEPVPDMMRSQLNLEQGVGLIVQRVQDGSPAAEAGVEKFDILMYADDQVLNSVTDLTGVVTEAGTAQQSFTLVVMRGGEEIPVEITPSERAMTAGLVPGRFPRGGFEMNDMGPGLIFDQAFDGDMMKRMQDHMQQVREEMKRMDGLLQNQGIPMPHFRMEAAPQDNLR